MTVGSLLKKGRLSGLILMTVEQQKTLFIACLFSLEFRLLYILYCYFCNAIAQLRSHGRGETLKTRLAIARK